MYKRKRLAFLCLGMVFAFLVNSVPGYAAEGIDSLPVAGTVSIDNSVPADPSSISEAAFDTDLPDSRSSAPESESTSVPADISNETKPDDVMDPASSTSRVEAETVTEPIEGSETGTDSETLLPAEVELKKIAPVDESPSETAARSADVGERLCGVAICGPSETAARSADVGDIPIDEQHFPGNVPFPVSWTVKMKKKQKETLDILSYHTQAAGCSDKARAKASGGRQPIEECGRTGL